MKKFDYFSFKIDMESYISKNGKVKQISKYNGEIDDNVWYYNVPCAFDTETTSTYTKDGNKFAFVYEWTFGIFDDDHVYYGRDIEELYDLVDILQEVFKTNDTHRFICYVHNLSFDFQFIKNLWEFEEVFARNMRKPLKVYNGKGIEFRDSLILSGLSLAKTAENLVSHKIEKMVGDLDYNLVRTPKTPLSQKELGYCEHDITIILAYIEEQIDQYGNITKIPMTNTGRVRNYIKKMCYGNSDGTVGNYSKFIHELTVSNEEYKEYAEAFTGGFTHANKYYSGKLLHDVQSWDFTSSYPAVILSEKFPMSTPEYIDVTYSEFCKLVSDDNYGLIFRVTLTNVKSIINYESYLSVSKCRNIKGALEDNGRVVSADYLETTMTDIDFGMFCKAYSFSSISVADVLKFKMDYLPTPILQSCVDFYKGKTELKGVKGKEAEYLMKKGMLNSIYGMMVTAIVSAEVSFKGGEWSEDELNIETIEEQIEKYNTEKRRTLYYPWGIYITSYARRNLWLGINEFKMDYIYSDTDSIKVLNSEKHMSFLNGYNEWVGQKIEKMCEKCYIKFEDTRPKTIKGVEKPIGVWDDDGHYDYFKTLGAKRYLTMTDGDYHLTVAGLGKTDGIKSILRQAGNRNPENVFGIFSNHMYIPEDETGKSTHTYIDNPLDDDVTDYLGETMHVTALSGVHLESQDFEMCQSKLYLKLLEMIDNGFLV